MVARVRATSPDDDFYTDGAKWLNNLTQRQLALIHGAVNVAIYVLDCPNGRTVWRRGGSRYGIS